MMDDPQRPQCDDKRAIDCVISSLYLLMVDNAGNRSSAVLEPHALARRGDPAWTV